MESVLTIILSIFSAAAILGGASALFLNARSKATIAILEASNAAYKERNSQLEQDIATLQKEVEGLKGKFDTLLRLKTPDIQPVLDQLSAQHTELMNAVAGKKS